MFKPSSTAAAVTFDANPAAYHLLGAQFPKGDKRRTISRSQLWDYRVCPHRWLNKTEEDEPTKFMEFGSLMDVLFLTPQLFERDYAVAPETFPDEGMKCPQCGSVTEAQTCKKCKCPREKVITDLPWDWARTYCKEWREERRKDGKSIVITKTSNDGQTALKRLGEDEEIAAIRASSQPQVMVCCDWHDKETGLIVPVKALLDLVPDPGSAFGDTVFDLKTTNDAAYRPWSRRVYDDGLYYQAAMYLDVLNAASGAKYRNFAHVILESKAPFESTMRPLSADWLDTGRIDYQNDLKSYCQSLTRGKFKGYDRDPVEPEPWMLKNS